jgi:hypothetical protein
MCTAGFLFPSGALSADDILEIVGEDCLSPKGEFRSRPQYRLAEGTRRVRRQGRLFFCTSSAKFSAHKQTFLSRCAGRYSICWIPAFAG